MRIAVMLAPNGRVGTYECAMVPRVGDALDLTEARGAGPAIDELETEPLFVLQVIHEIGPEPENHRPVLRVVPLREVAPGSLCPWIPPAG
jgi:hypothetical protein